MSKPIRLGIIGGGAAGIMAAISAKRHHPEIQVTILDRTFTLGRKILICGAGRCNITNINLVNDASRFYYGAKTNFVDKVFSNINYHKIVEIFEELGIDMYVERKTDIGKMFPTTDQAKTVTAVLENELKLLGVEVLLNTEVTKITNMNNQYNLQLNLIDKSGKILEESNYFCDKLIISAGGKTYPALGSNGSGYDLARKLGHNIIAPVPSAVPLECSNQITHLLQGTRVDAEATAIIADKEIKSRIDEIIFTKYGLSGPAILNISREISIRQNRVQISDSKVRLNFFPGRNTEEVIEILNSRWQKRPNLTIAGSLYGLFPNKMADIFMQIVGYEGLIKDLNEKLKFNLINLLTNSVFNVTATRGWNEAEFTAGGIDTNEVESDTLASKIDKNIYFAGEILNVDGDVGGFNLSWAWSSGWQSGKLL